MYSCWLWCLRKCLVKACGVLGYCLILCFPDCVDYGLDVLVVFGCGLLGLAVVWVLFYLLGWFFGYWIFGFIGFEFVLLMMRLYLLIVLAIAILFIVVVCLAACLLVCVLIDLCSNAVGLARTWAWDLLLVVLQADLVSIVWLLFVLYLCCAWAW